VLALLVLIVAATACLIVAGYVLYALVQSARGKLPTQRRADEPTTPPHPGGQAIVDEPGPEIIHIPRGTSMRPVDPRDRN